MKLASPHSGCFDTVHRRIDRALCRSNGHRVDVSPVEDLFAVGVNAGVALVTAQC